MTKTRIPILTSFDDVKAEIWEGDLIFLRNRKGKYVRAAKASRWNNELFYVDVHPLGGVTAAPLDQLVLRNPGRIDVYEVNPWNQWKNYDRLGSTLYLKTILFYGNDNRSVLIKVLWRMFSALFRIRNRSRKESTPYRAEAIRIAERIGGGVDPIPDKTGERIDVSDLEQSSLYRYRFTLK